MIDVNDIEDLDPNVKEVIGKMDAKMRKEKEEMEAKMVAREANMRKEMEARLKELEAKLLKGDGGAFQASEPKTRKTGPGGWSSLGGNKILPSDDDF